MGMLLRRYYGEVAKTPEKKTVVAPVEEAGASTEEKVEATKPTKRGRKTNK